MDNGELSALRDCEVLCRRLINKLKADAENVEISFKGQLLVAYRELIAEAVKRLIRVEYQLSDMRRDVELLSQV